MPEAHVKAWKDMTPKERAAHARSFIGKKAVKVPGRKVEYDPDLDISDTASVERWDIPARGRPKNVTPDLGQSFAKLTQAQRDAILHSPSINRPQRRP